VQQDTRILFVSGVAPGLSRELRHTFVALLPDGEAALKERDQRQYYFRVFVGSLGDLMYAVPIGCICT